MSFCCALSLSLSPVMKTMLNESQLAARRGDGEVGTKELPNSLFSVQGIVRGGGKSLLSLADLPSPIFSPSKQGRSA